MALSVGSASLWCDGWRFSLKLVFALAAALLPMATPVWGQGKGPDRRLQPPPGLQGGGRGAGRRCAAPPGLGAVHEVEETPGEKVAVIETTRRVRLLPSATRTSQVSADQKRSG